MRDVVRRFLPQLIYGANDGVVTTLAIIAGVVGAGLPTAVILILGFANLLADGVSMGASAVLSARSRIAHRPSLREATPEGLATFLGFLCAGIVPLTAYLLPWFEGDRFASAIVLAALTLFIVGSGRALFSDHTWLRAGAEMLVIGTAAAAIAYGVGLAGATLVDDLG